MALPAGVASVRVHSEAIVDAAGNPVNGYLYLTVPQEITHAGSGMVVVPQTVKVQVSAGTFDATVVATDAAGLSLSSWTYQASEKWTGGRSFPLALPSAAPDVEYASLVPTVVSAGTVMVPALVESVNGQSGAVVLTAADVGADPSGAAAAAQAAAVAASEPPVRAGTLAGRPSASAGKGFYLATDISGGTLYHSDGTTWTQVSGAVNPSGKILANVLAYGG